MNKPSDYKCIARWGKMMGSYLSYIAHEQEKASKDNAPLTAIYQRDGKWSVAEDIVRDDLRKQILGEE